MQTKHNVIFTFTQVFTLAQRDPVCLSAIITNYLTDLRGADEILLSKLDSAVLHEDANNSSFFRLTSDQSPAWPDTLSSSGPGRSLLWVKHGGRRWRSPCCCSVYSNTVTNTKMQFGLTESESACLFPIWWLIHGLLAFQPLYEQSESITCQRALPICPSPASI